MRRHLTRIVFQPWWRLTRGLTLGVRGVVTDPEAGVLLVRHSYVEGWHLPGGGVERGETARMALSRELAEEAGIHLTTPARLHGLFASEREFPGDHVAVFVAEDWRRDKGWRPGSEILEARFFALGTLPEETTAGTRRRLAEVYHAIPLTETW